MCEGITSLQVSQISSSWIIIIIIIMHHYHVRVKLAFIFCVNPEITSCILYFTYIALYISRLSLFLTSRIYYDHLAWIPKLHLVWTLKLHIASVPNYIFAYVPNCILRDSRITKQQRESNHKQQQPDKRSKSIRHSTR